MNKLGYTFSGEGCARAGLEEGGSKSKEAGRVVDIRTEFDAYSFFGLRFIPPEQRCIWGGFPEAGARPQ